LNYEQMSMAGMYWLHY